MPAIACRKLLTLALSEERGGSDALGLDTIAARQTDGSWILNGSKCWITNAGVADGYIVGAKTNLNSRSRSGSPLTGWSARASSQRRSGADTGVGRRSR